MCIPRQSPLPNMQLRQRSCPWCFHAKRMRMDRHNRRQATLQREESTRRHKEDTKKGTKCALLGPQWFGINQRKCFGKNGGDDGTRTRGFCRDSSGIQLLSTTWKTTDGTVSHGKYIIGNAIVYRDVYRGSTTSSASDGVSSQNFAFTVPPRGTPNLTCLPPDVPSFARANHRSHSVISGTNRRRGRALNERIVKNDILWHRHRRRSH